MYSRPIDSSRNRSSPVEIRPTVRSPSVYVRSDDSAEGLIRPGGQRDPLSQRVTKSITPKPVRRSGSETRQPHNHDIHGTLTSPYYRPGVLTSPQSPMTGDPVLHEVDTQTKVLPQHGMVESSTSNPHGSHKDKAPFHHHT